MSITSAVIDIKSGKFTQIDLPEYKAAAEEKWYGGKTTIQIYRSDRNALADSGAYGESMAVILHRLITDRS